MRLIFLLLSLITFALEAQKETSVWHFGDRSQVNFNTSPPTVSRNGRLGGNATISTISDTSGSLLFYTDGDRVYDRNHNLMPNGTGLGASSAIWQHSTLIAPWPDSTSLYYVFSLSRWLPYRLQYAIVDLRQNGGLGAVTSKNQALSDSINYIAGTFQTNSRDLWIVTHSYPDNTFKIYEIDSNGLNTTPRVQQIGERPTLRDDMKLSHTGKHLVLLFNAIGRQFLEVFDFDNATGTLSNPVRIDRGSNYVDFSMEFSPNDLFLYAGSTRGSPNRTKFVRYHLKAPDLAASREDIDSLGGKFVTDLLLGNDGHIYASYGLNGREPYLSRLENPNTLGKVNLVAQALPIGFWVFPYFLPRHVRGYNVTIGMSDLCEGKPITFKLNTPRPVATANWDFGDGTPKVNQITPQHTYTKPGIYGIEVDYTYAGSATITLKDTIEIDTAGVRIIPFDDLCLSSLPFTLTQASPAGGTYKGRGIKAGSNIFNPTAAGVGSFPITYVYSSRYGCRDSLTRNITIQPPQPLNLNPGLDTFCLVSPTINLNRVSPAGGTYRGSGVTGSQFSPRAAGLGTHPITYIFTDSCRSTRTFNLTVTAQGRQLQFSKLVSKDICGRTIITCTNTSPAGTNGFTWKAGDGTAPVKARDFTHTYTRAGTYTVSLEADCGRTATQVVVVPPNLFRYQADTTICAGDTIRLQASGADRYTWRPTSSLDNPNIGIPLIFPTVSTDYIVKMEKGSCIVYDTVKVTVLNTPTLNFKSDVVAGCDSLQSLSLRNNAATTLDISWRDEGGNLLTALNQTTIQVKKPRKLQVYLSSGAGRCIKRDTVSFDLGLNSKYLAKAGTSIKSVSGVTNCGLGKPIQLEASGGTTYLWRPAAGLSDPAIANPVATPTTSTTYTVKIGNSAGCTVERSLNLEILSTPKVDLAIDMQRQVCSEVPAVSFKNKVSAATEYQWDFGDGNTSKEPAPVHRYAKGGKYEVKLRAVHSNTCFRDTTFEVEVEQALIYNAFSPNGDGLNEVLDFGLEGWGVEVYNRWGRLVYESSDYKNDWRGGDLPAGTYYYTLRSPAGYDCRGWVALLK